MAALARRSIDDLRKIKQRLFRKQGPTEQHNVEKLGEKMRFKVVAFRCWGKFISEVRY